MYVQKKSAILLAMFIICCCFSNSLAQSLEGGITGGFNLSTHSDKFRYIRGVALTPNNAAGYQAGFFIRAAVTDPLRIQIEPTFIKLGARYNESFTFLGVEYETESWTKLLYLQFPLLFQYSPSFFVPTTQSSYHLTGGFFMGYLLDAQFNGRNTDGNEESDLPLEGEFSNDVLIQYSRYDGGAIIGLGYKGDSKLGFEMRLQYTLLQSYQGNPQFKPKNKAITFSLSYRL